MAERTEESPGQPTRRVGDSPEPGKDATQDEIVADIEKTREQLRESVDSLSSRLDVKANAKAQIEQTKQTMSTKVSEATRAVQAHANPAIVTGAVVAVVVAVVGLVVWGRRR